MFALRMAFVLLLAGSLFMYALDAYLPAVLFYTIGALWSVYALMQIAESEADEEEK